jgi:hypothetical protein
MGVLRRNTIFAYFDDPRYKKVQKGTGMPANQCREKSSTKQTKAAG